MCMGVYCSTLFFYIKASNFRAKAERFFLRFEPVNVLNMSFKLCGIVFQ